jgi:chemotaxis family two-component system response regulator PixH
VEVEAEMVEQTPREYLTKILELSRQMVGLASIDPGYELDTGCRTVFGALCDYGYALKKMAEEELAAHQAAEDSASEESSLVAGTSSPGDPWTVLIVNDDRDFLKHLALLFQDNGFETLTAVSRHEAMELTSTSRPDLIILDISMPGKSGVSVYQDLKEDAELGAIPVVLVTAIGDPFSQFAEGGGQVSGAVGFVAKPLDVDLLWEAVREALRSPSR